MRPGLPRLPLDRLDAVVLDADGVIIDTARSHAQAWKRVFDELLRRRGRQVGEPQPPFEIRADYLRFLDGRSPLDGVRAFLRARGLRLPDGDDADGEHAETVHGLAARHDAYVRQEIGRSGVVVFPASVALLRELKRRGARIAVVSDGRGLAQVLGAAHLTHLVDAQVDGDDLARLGLPERPDPALFLEACRRLAVEAGRCALIEDSAPGLEAGVRGGFSLVIGVDRSGTRAPDLQRAGAHLVVGELTELDARGRRTVPSGGRP